MSRRSSSLEASGLRSSRATPPTRAATPRNATMESIKGVIGPLVLQHHALTEGAGGQAHAGLLQAVHERGPHAGGFEAAVGPAVLVDALFLVGVDVLHDDRL